MRGFIAVFLHLAADPTERKTLPGHFLACNGNLVSNLRLFAKIDFTKIHLGQKLETKRKVRIHFVSVNLMLVVKFHQHLFIIKHRLTIIGVIRDPALPVGSGGKNLPHTEHQAFLAGIRP